MYDLATGFGGAEIVSGVLRGTLGTFFAISGYHKLFNEQRRATLKQTFIDCGCYHPAMMWTIPLGELFGGLGLLFGAFTPIACVGLILICSGACALDGFKRVRQYQPLDKADFVDDVLYLPEFLYIIMLSSLAILGPGQWSVDGLLGLII